MDYLLAESVVMVKATIEQVEDSEAGTDELDYDKADIEVLLGVRGDVGNGTRELTLGGSGDDDLTVDFAGDRRLVAISYKSVGVGSRVMNAAATVVATVAGIAVRTGGLTFGFAMGEQTRETGRSEDEIREQWNQAHDTESTHRDDYSNLVEAATKKLREAREAVVESDDPEAIARASARAYRLQAVVTASQEEVDKVDELYRLWRDSKKKRRNRHLEYTLSVDTLPEVAGDNAAPDPTSLTGTAKTIWDDVGVLVQIGPADGWSSHRQSGGESKPNGVEWRIPRLVRLWVWRRGEDDKPSLEHSFHATIVDKHSESDHMSLDTSAFGEKGGAVAFDELGAVTKIVRNDKSGLGSFADALGGLPAAVASGLDSASKISTSVTSLADASAERRLATLKRQVEQQTKELEKKGLAATAQDFAELKRLEQQVAIADANTKLASPGGLAHVQGQLALEAAYRDLEMAERERALANETAETNAEISRLTAEVQLATLQKGELPEEQEENK